MLSKRFFNVIKNDVSEEIEEKKSIFMGFAQKVKTEDDVKAFLQAVRKVHPDATHICYAFILGQTADISRSCDDGEPAGTAGQPILEMIKKFKLTNCLVAVVRYFGGKELGKSGLTKTYGKIASKVLMSADYCSMVECAMYEFRFTYNDFSKVSRYLNDNEYPILKQDYSDVVRVETAFPAYKEQIVLGELKTLLGGKFMNSKIKNVFCKFDGKEREKR